MSRATVDGNDADARNTASYVRKAARTGSQARRGSLKRLVKERLCLIVADYSHCTTSALHYTYTFARKKDLAPLRVPVVLAPCFYQLGLVLFSARGQRRRRVWDCAYPVERLEVGKAAAEDDHFLRCARVLRVECFRVDLCGVNTYRCIRNAYARTRAAFGPLRQKTRQCLLLGVQVCGVRTAAARARNGRRRWTRLCGPRRACRPR